METLLAAFSAEIDSESGAFDVTCIPMMTSTSSAQRMAIGFFGADKNFAVMELGADGKTYHFVGSYNSAAYRSIETSINAAIKKRTVPAA